MNREEARQTIRKNIDCRRYLTKSKSGLYNCPFCGSGTGKNATGALKVYDTNTFYCHACEKSGDVIDLYQQETGTDYNTALSLMANELGITIDHYNLDAAPKYDTASTPQSDLKEGGQGNTPAKQKNAQNENMAATEGNADYRAYYRECRARINAPEAVKYLKGRGISPETAAAYYIGYDPAADPAQSNHPCPRIIIPTSRAHYIGRRIDGGGEYAKLNPKGSTPDIFNKMALTAQDVQVVFITEGAFDALSVLEIGAAAIALNSTSNAQKLITLLEQHRTAATLVLCLDNDKAGKDATITLREGLSRLGISYIVADICAGYKDPNAALTGNREAFRAAVENAIRRTAPKPDNTAYYIDSLMTEDIERFKTEKKTGFTNLDEKSGGLYSGLYVLAAISSLGKTSFALQMADQLAAAKNEVIFFSLEQSRLEMVSKSLARRTAQKNRDRAVTSLAIRKGHLPPVVLDAAEEYKREVCDRISIVEGTFSCNISFISDYIRHYIARNGTRPVVFIDYLQILQPESDKKQSTKEAIDAAVKELKDISREFNITVIAISSVNRANYLTPIDFESLKESGIIEFTSDVVWGLQLQCLNDPAFDKTNNIKERREIIKKAKAENPRKIELCCLKNRYGIANYSCYFKYYPANDLFTECSTAEVTFTPAQPIAGRKI